MYNKSEVEKAALEFFGDSLVANVWLDKYALREKDSFLEKSPDDTIKRLAGELYRIELKYPNPASYDSIYELLKNYNKFVLGGSSIFGIGNNTTLSTLGNCFVVKSPEDSIGGIFAINEELAQIMKRRGGVGVDLSTIRPKKSHVNNAAISSTGVVPFMKLYSATTRTIAQEGRRGALMLTLDVDHDDIEDFITAKDDLNEITGANISVRIDDNFMGWLIGVESEDNRTYKDVKRIWDKIIHQAWKTAEPGVIFWDKVINESPADCYDDFKTISTNPCFHPDTLIETVEGRKKISEIDNFVHVYSMDENNNLCIRLAHKPFISKKDVKTIKITLRNNNYIQITENHKLFIHDKGWIEAKDLVVGDRVVHLSRNRRGKRYSGVKLTTQYFRDYIMEHKLVYEGVYGEVDHNTDIHHKDGDTFNNKINNLQEISHNEHSRHTATYDNPQVHQVRDSLGKFTSPEHKYNPKIVNIPEELKTNLKNKGYNRIIKIEEGDTIDVYDIQVEGTNCLIANNMVAHNCGELPLCAYDSCRLSALNLYAYVVNPFTIDSGFDLEALATDTILAQRLMDDIVDLEDEKIVAILNKIKSDPEQYDTRHIETILWNKMLEKLLVGRRTGLGQMGLADAGAACGLHYGESYFIYLADQINRTIAANSYLSSIILAKERGKFPAWELDKEKDNPYIQRVLSLLPQKFVDDYKVFGRRNIANLTIAPTGTISMLAGVTSGIEPVYALTYDRKRKVSADHPNKKFQDKQGDWWEVYKVFHPKFKEWYKNEGYSIDEGEILDKFIEKSPYFKSTAYDINPYDKLKVQAAIQPWIDHSISVTYNLPKTATEDDISKLYLQAWKLGLKGLTVYRDGSREGILTTEKQFHQEQHDAVRRPKDLICDAYNIKAKGQDWKVFIGILDDLPYEVFAVNGTMEKVPIDRGILRKRASGTYDFLSPTEEIVRENITLHMTPEEEALTRMISWALRHGSKLQFGVEQLDKSKGDVTSFSKAIARTLKKYIKDGTIRNNLHCPDCDSILVDEGGCLVCKNCGFSKCG